MKLTVQPGDTLGRLTQIALQQAQPSAAPTARLPFGLLMQKVQAVAEQNQIRNPDRIFAGQVIDFSTLFDTHDSAASGAPAPASAGGATAVAPVEADRTTRTTHLLLEQTLDRAVARGYIPQHDLPEVRRQILDMARQYGFQPDDLARVALIESDGFNPKASNGNCHGVIQFCNGDGRGAASVGFGKNPRAILNLSVKEQLGLVNQYFEDTGLKNYRAPSLETLYLTVLFPAARDERQPHKPLPIPGPQAAVLHVGANQAAPITRASLRKGLIDNAGLRLAQFAQEQSRQKAYPVVAAQLMAQAVDLSPRADRAEEAAVRPRPASPSGGQGLIPRMPELLPNFSVPSVSTQSVLQSRRAS